VSEGLRLNRYLALAGVASRRGADELVAAGRVVLNGEVCTKPGVRVGEGDYVKVDGRRVQPKRFTTVLVHKPRGLVCSKSDELGRKTVDSLLPTTLRHLAHVGRLDRDSEGLLVLTNDGSLAYRLTHPSHRVEKEYVVTLDHAIDDFALARMVSGVHTPEGKLVAKSTRRLSARRILVILDHGVKRQIRIMFSALGFEVVRLVRTRIGALSDATLAPGEWRMLNAGEIETLLGTRRKPRKNPGRRQRKKL
jgi:23S rRNA pseudouridine2605 synthase